jgi:hypothetical protein
MAMPEKSSSGRARLICIAIDWKGKVHWQPEWIDIQRTQWPAHRKPMRLCLTPHN